MKSIPTDIFRIDMPPRRPSVGSLLVAEPFLTDSWFNHAVILLVDCEEGKSTMGIMMNRDTGHTLGGVIHGFDDNIDVPLFCGGPVSTDRLFYIHSLGTLFDGAVPLHNGLYIGGDYEQVCQYIADGNPTEGYIRFFIGYSGWDPGQLNDELSSHTWAVGKALPARQMLEGAENAYWHKTVRSLGDEYHSWLYHPMNPSAN